MQEDGRISSTNEPIRLLTNRFREAAKIIEPEENNMEQFTIRELYTLEETIAADLFEGAVYPRGIRKDQRFIRELGEKLPQRPLYGSKRACLGCQ